MNEIIKYILCWLGIIIITFIVLFLLMLTQNTCYEGSKVFEYEDLDGHYFLNNRDKKIYIGCDEIDFMVDKFNELIDEINNLKEKYK